MIDLYCERLGPGLWAEPINALTNLAFLLAAWASWLMVRHSATRSRDVTLLLVLMVVIGIGSGLFHTFATTWARVLDVVPILLFQIGFMWVYARTIILMRTGWSAIFVGAFFVAALVGRQFPDVLNGALKYAPPLLAFLCFGVYHYKMNKRERWVLLAASGAFLLALLFRTIDQAVCPYIPIGTHFLWHVLDAAVLYLAMRGLILNWPSSGASRGGAE
jgi:hypothetical protein